MYKLVVLLSGKGSNLQAIIDQISSGEINAEISAVISNRADALGLKRAEKAGIQNIVLEHAHFSDREAFDQSLAQIIESYEPDLIILAGFMRILSDGFVKQFQGQLINIHPSLLPAFKGLHTHKRALIDYKKGLITEHGASVHFVIPELDTGAVIIHGNVPILTDDSEESLAQRVHQIEHIIYPKAIKWLADDNLELINDRVFLDGNEIIKPKKISL